MQPPLINQNSLSNGQYNGTPRTLADGEFGSDQHDALGNKKVTIATKVSQPSDAPVMAFSPDTKVLITPITTAATTVVSTQTGITAGHVFLYVQGGTLGAVTVYDNTAASGTILTPMVTAFAGQWLCFDVPFRTGLTVVTAAATIITGYVLPE